MTVVKLDSRAETPRHRRLEPGEQERLLQHAGDHLRALIVAILFTGCRVGELLNLTWNQIRRDEDGKPRLLMLPATNTKTYRLRPIPIGVRLSAELDMLQHGPDGTAFGPEAFVFGNRVGEKVNSVKKAWAGACRRAGISGLQIRDLRREFCIAASGIRGVGSRRAGFPRAREHHDDEPLSRQQAAAVGTGVSEVGSWRSSHIGRTNSGSAV